MGLDSQKNHTYLGVMVCGDLRQFQKINLLGPALMEGAGRRTPDGNGIRRS